VVGISGTPVILDVGERKRVQIEAFNIFSGCGALDQILDIT
jgi:hypothetical protein